MPLFSVIMPHYQGTVQHAELLRAVGSLRSQTFKDFELLLYHDGPLLDESVPMPTACHATETRFNDWGHSLRDLGIRAAKGDYIVHLNADNVLYPNALEEIAKGIARPARVIHEQHGPLDPNDIVVFPIYLRGYQVIRDLKVRNPQCPDWSVILPGYPVTREYVDAMQLVHRL